MSRPPLGNTLDIFGLHIPWYSLLIMAAFAIGIWLASREEDRLGLPRETIVTYALWMIPAAIVGARLYYVIFSWSHFSGNFMEIFRVWNGGLAIYGGIIAAVAVAYVYARRRKLSLWTLADACAPALALGQAIGRWGNYANMEAYGARIYNPSAQFFPIAVEVRLVGANGAEYWYWHMATFFYESMLCLAIFVILMLLRRAMEREGDVFLWYLLMYCAGRTVIEGLRDDSLLLNVAAAQVRISQILSALVCVGVVALFFIRLKRLRKIHLADYLAWAVVGVGIACTFVGEFERNAYQMLFIPAQILLAGLLGLDAFFFAHYFRKARMFDTPAIAMLVAAGLSLLTLLLGIGRLGAANTAYVALRQSVAMLHVILGGAWLYLRCGSPTPGNAGVLPRERTQEGRRLWQSGT